MKKNFIFIIFFPVLFLFFLQPAQPQNIETISITTYYPAPFGVYSRLATNTLGVGDNNGDGTLNDADAPDPAANPGDAWIAGQVGIGTRTPQSTLDVNGSVAIGVNYAGNNAAPANGLLVEGDMGIGTTAPNLTTGSDLVVNNTVRLVPARVAPQAHSEGAIYYNNNTHRLNYYDGAQWQELSGFQWGHYSRPPDRRSPVLVAPRPNNFPNDTTSVGVRCPYGYVAVQAFLVTGKECVRTSCRPMEIQRIGLRCRQIID